MSQLSELSSEPDQDAFSETQTVSTRMGEPDVFGDEHQEDPADPGHNKRSYRLRFVLNNPTEPEVRHLESVLSRVGQRDCRITYLVYGNEVAPTTGTPHLQGYCEYRQSTWPQIRLVLGERFAFKSCKCSGESNARYCKKDGDYKEAGTIRVGQGKRSDLEGVAADVLAGNKRREIAMTHPEAYIKYAKGINMLIGCCEKPRTVKPWVLVFWGPTGTGKSTMALKLAKAAGTYFYKDHTKWWQGYEQQTTVIFEEFRSEQCTLPLFLRTHDFTEMTVETKGDSAQLKSAIHVLTTPFHPNDWYADVTTEDKRQILRRIDHIVHFPALTLGAGLPQLLGNMPDVPACLASFVSPTPWNHPPENPQRSPSPSALPDPAFEDIIEELARPPPLTRSYHMENPPIRQTNALTEVLEASDF